MTVMIHHARKSSSRARWAIAVLALALSTTFLALWPLAAGANHPEPTLPLTADIVQGLSDCAPPAPDTGTSIPAGTAGNATTPPDRNNTSTSNEHTPGTFADFVIHANAESDPKELTLDISGSHNIFDGLIDSRSHLKIGGSWNLFRHGTEYGQRSAGKVAFDLTGSNNCFSPIPVQEYENAPPASPAGFPLSSEFDPDQDGNILEHFAPGTAPATAAMGDPTPGPQYFVCGIPDPDGGAGGAAVAPGCSGSGASAIMDRNVQGQQLERGLYFVTGRAKLSASNLNATLTVVSGQQLNVNGSFQGQGVSVFNPYTDAGGAILGDLLFASQWDEAASLSGPTFPDGSTANDSPNTDKGEDALKVEGSLSRFEGIIVATNGRTEIAGEQLDFRCPVMGDRVRVNGSKNYFNASGCTPSPALTITKTPDAGPAGTIAAGDAGVFTIVITNSGGGTATAVTLEDDLPNTGGITWSLTSAVKSPPPAGGTNVAAGCNPGPGGLLPNAKELDCDFGDLAPGQTVTVVVTSSATTSGGNCGQLPNGNGKLDNGLDTADTADDAIADASNADPVTNPGQIIVACPDVSVVKTPDESSPAGSANDINAGEDAVFTITFANNGPGVASSVPLNDQLPTANGLDWSIVSQGFGPGFTAGSACSLDAADLLTCQVNDMASGASYRVVVKATTGAANCGSIPNTVTISPAGDINPANNSDPGEIDVACPNVTVDKTPDGGAAGTINAGDAAVFTIVIANTGLGAATGVSLDDDLPNDGGITWSLTSAVKSAPPAGGTDVSAGCNPGAGGALPDAQELDCSFGNLAPGQTVTVVVTSSANTAATCGELENGNGLLDNGLETAGTTDDAIADATNTGPDEDPGQIIVACAEVTVDKTPDGGLTGTIEAGDAAVFTIVIANTGLGAATGVSLDDDLPNDGGITWSLTSAVKSAPPAGGTDVSAGCNPGAGGALPDAQELDCSFGNLAPGQTVTVVVTSSATTSAGNCGDLTNGNGVLDNGLETAGTTDDAIADATNTGPDEDPGQIIVACPDVSVAKSPDEADPPDAANDIDAGQDAVFTIVVTNNGPGVASNTTLNDQLPTANGLDWSIVSQGLGPGFTGGSACSLTAADLLSCTITNLAEIGRYEIVVKSTTTAAACGPIPNTVTITPAGDIDSANNSDTGEIDVNCASIRILKQSTKTGSPLVTNAGAVFAVDGPDDGAAVDFSVRDDNNPVHAAPGRADEVTVMGIGIVCVSGLAPGDYTVNETSPPEGYGASSQTNLTAVAVTGTNCTDDLPALTDTAAFQNPPLADIQVNYRDGGSTETSLTSIDCDDDGVDPLGDMLDLVPALTWEKSLTHEDIPIDPSPRTVTCLIVIDP